jgi:hypothetical protein
MTNAYSQFEIVSWSWLDCAKLKVNAQHSAHGTLNLGKPESKHKICHDVDTYTVGTIFPINYIYMFIQAFAQLYVNQIDDWNRFMY